MKKNSNENVTDLTYLKQVSNGDNAFIKEMIEVYMQQTPEAICNLEKHLKNKDWKKLQAVTHKMKPSFSFFGLTHLNTLVNDLEEYADKAIHLEMIPGMIQKVKQTCEKAMLELAEKKKMEVII